MEPPHYDPAGSVAMSVVSNYGQLTLTNQQRAFNPLNQSDVHKESILNISVVKFTLID